jgi:uncharacterized protein YydD (DUF2326 family)
VDDFNKNKKNNPFTQAVITEKEKSVFEDRQKKKKEKKKRKRERVVMRVLDSQHCMLS